MFYKEDTGKQRAFQEGVFKGITVMAVYSPDAA